MFKILVAEDDNSARRLLCEVLSGYGYETIPAVDGAQALELLQAHHADLIVLDVMMPRMDGLQLTRRLREEGHTTPILMLTARETTQDKCRGFLSGADDYVVKPVDEEELALRIAALLRRSQIASERKIVVGDVTLSYDTQSVTRGEESVELPKKAARTMSAMSFGRRMKIWMSALNAPPSQSRNVDKMPISAQSASARMLLSMPARSV